MIRSIFFTIDGDASCDSSAHKLCICKCILGGEVENEDGVVVVDDDDDDDHDGDA